MWQLLSSVRASWRQRAAHLVGPPPRSHASHPPPRTSLAPAFAQTRLRQRTAGLVSSVLSPALGPSARTRRSPAAAPLGRQHTPESARMTSAITRMFSKATPSADVSKLKPGAALPHVTLPTTEARLGCGRRRGRRAEAADARRRRPAVGRSPPLSARSSPSRSLPPLFLPATSSCCSSFCCTPLPPSRPHAHAPISPGAGRPRGGGRPHGSVAAGGGVPGQA